MTGEPEMGTESGSNELVSVVVPTHYRNDRLREALDSVAGQEHRPIEVVVVDGADDEHARPVVEKYDAAHADLDCTYVPQERDEGPQAARSLGVEEADGTYVQLLDDDDRLAPSKIRKQVELLDSSVGAEAGAGDEDRIGGEDGVGDGVGVAYCGMRDEQRGEILPNPVVRGNVIGRALEMRTFPAINSTMLVERRTLDRVRPFRHRHGADDTGLKIDLALQTQFDFVDEPLVYRGRTGSSLSESWSYLDGRKEVMATYDQLYRQFPDRIRQRALRETHYQAGRKLLAERSWSPRATAQFARSAWETPDDYTYHLAAALGSVLGRPGLAAVDQLFGRDGN